MEQNNKLKKRVVVFGIFDGLHLGHEHFLQQARAYGDEIVVIVGRDEIALQLKGKTSQLNERQRRSRVAAHHLVDRAVLGDKETGEYLALKRLKPDVVCLGYDQKELKKDIYRWMKENGAKIVVRVMKAYKPREYHTSIINE
ncbi:MAG: adenylyltransferase/cytidyltransferase family protein [Candidatus Spechtbacteria bacterium]|nr:adenylyltransferase/cytidyltransferase family protein [Candidatus Spechtbacteria bacterium]